MHGPESFTRNKLALNTKPLREQVQTLAREQRIRDLSSKQIGLDPMPEFPIHAPRRPFDPGHADRTAQATAACNP